jgi:hypothetical protein
MHGESVRKTTIAHPPYEWFQARRIQCPVPPYNRKLVAHSTES